jgi:hypothetical protein
MSNFWREFLAILLPALAGFGLGLIKIFCNCKKLLGMVKRKKKGEGDDDDDTD